MGQRAKYMRAVILKTMPLALIPLSLCEWKGKKIEGIRVSELGVTPGRGLPLDVSSGL